MARSIFYYYRKCLHLVYRFPEELKPELTTPQREAAKEKWKDELEVKCGWGKRWIWEKKIDDEWVIGGNVPGCVDPRGCR